MITYCVAIDVNAVAIHLIAKVNLSTLFTSRHKLNNHPAWNIWTKWVKMDEGHQAITISFLS